MTFRLLRPAWRELREAAKYYQDHVPGLGFDFLQEVRAAIRRCRTHRFPYGLIYTIERDEVLIISVMHLHRHPESWRRNLP